MQTVSTDEIFIRPQGCWTLSQHVLDKKHQVGMSNKANKLSIYSVWGGNLEAYASSVEQGTYLFSQI